jgi:hypothetical protein
MKRCKNCGEPAPKPVTVGTNKSKGFLCEICGHLLIITTWKCELEIKDAHLHMKKNRLFISVIALVEIENGKWNCFFKINSHRAEDFFEFLGAKNQRDLVGIKIKADCKMALPNHLEIVKLYNGNKTFKPSFPPSQT